MLSLSLYSSSSSVSLLLANNEKVLRFFEFENEKKVKTDKIFQLLEILSKEQDLKSLDLIFLSRGPGGFTSIRQIISLAQGLSLNSNAKIFSVTMFEIILSDMVEIKFPALVFFRESRKDFYFQLYSFKNNKWEPKSKIFSGTQIDIQNKVKILRNKNNFNDIILVSNNHEKEFSSFESVKCIVLKTNAKSIYQLIKKQYGKKSLKPIYFHPHYAQKK